MSMKTRLTAPERLVVAADFHPRKGEDRISASYRALEFCHKLENTGVYIKVNSIGRAIGYDLIDAIHSLGLKVFADLKLNDIPNTLRDDGGLLFQAKPEIVTVMCSAGAPALWELKDQLPDTEVLGVTILTSLDMEDVVEIYGCVMSEAVERLARLASRAKLDGLVCAPKQAERLKRLFKGLSMNTPGVRPAWATVSGDDQNAALVMTPAQAIKAGADRIVVGRPITGADDPYAAVVRTIEEIDKAT